MQHLALMSAIAALCYLMIPGLGAIAVRRRWRRFRARVIDAAETPMISSHLPIRAGIPTERLGVFRFAGALEAIQGQNTVWLRGAQLSVAVEMDDVRVYMLPSESEISGDGPEGVNAPEHPLLVLRWRKLHAMVEGTGFYVVGAAYREHGKIVFKAEADQPLLVLVYDGDQATVLERALWYGRHRNEYWNPVTLPALAVGAITLAWLAYYSLGTPFYRTHTLVAAVLASMPVLPLLPPGTLFLVLYQRLWKQGRLHRAQRDMLVFKAPDRREDAGSYARSAERAELASLATLAIGLGLNAYLLLIAITALLL